MSEWNMVNGGKYKIELDGWNFVVERKNPLINGSRYKFQVYENMDRPQSASALEVEVDNSSLLDFTSNCEGALQHIVKYFIKVGALSYPGIPEPLESNLINALKVISS